jgi:hypothetical protein
MSITRTCRRRSSAADARSNAVGPAAARSDAVKPAAARSDAVGPAPRMVDAGFGPGPVVPYFGAFWEPTRPALFHRHDRQARHCRLNSGRLPGGRGLGRQAGARSASLLFANAWLRPNPRRCAVGRLDRVHPVAGAALDQQSYRDPGGSAAFCCPPPSNPPAATSATSGETSRDSGGLVTLLTVRWGAHRGVGADDVRAQR